MSHPYPSALSAAGTTSEPAERAERERLQPLTAALLEFVTPTDVVATVVERGVAVLGAEAGLVVLVHENRETHEPYLDVVGAQGYAEDVMGAWQQFPLSAKLPLSDAVREQTPLFFVNRADMAVRYPEMFQRGVTHPVKSSVSLPLVARGRAFGGLHFSFPHERDDFSDADRAFLLELSRQCALALDRALLLERLEEERARAEAARLEAEAARTGQEFLARASALLAESLHYQSRLERLARLCVPELADWAGVDMRDETGQILRLAVAHRVPERERAMREMQERYPSDAERGPNTVTVIETGERLFYPDIAPELIEQGARDADHARLINEVGIRAVLSLPLTARGRTLGAITLGMGPEPAGSGRLFTPESIALLEEVAHRAAVAVDNARLYEQAQRDLDERRRAEEALQASEANYRLVTDTIPQIIWGATKDGWVDFVHPRIGHYTGVPANEVVQSGWLCVVHPDDRATATERWIQSLNTGQYYETEFRLVLAGGDYGWHLASALPVQGQDGDIVRWFGTLTNIEERRRLQNQVEAERMAALENQRRFLREMLFGMTEGHLRLCDSPAELPSELPHSVGPIPLSTHTLRVVRQQVETAAQNLDFAKERTHDLMTAVSEAAMNAVNHAGGGISDVRTDTGTKTIQVWIRDRGAGIAEHLIHRAVESGWTMGGFGQGFHLMWKTCDRLYLLTGPSGTTVVLETDRDVPPPVWLEAVS